MCALSLSLCVDCGHVRVGSASIRVMDGQQHVLTHNSMMRDESETERERERERARERRFSRRNY